MRFNDSVCIIVKYFEIPLSNNSKLIRTNTVES